MNLTLKIWRQNSSRERGQLETFPATDISPDMSFLEMLDLVNEQLLGRGIEPIAFEHDCREGICGCCSLVIDGRPHGPEAGTTVCQLHMRSFKDGDTITIEPWRSSAFTVVKDLVVDRSAFDRIMQKGGYVSVNTGSAVDANANLIPKDDAEAAFDAATCIGCGACVASCPNGAAMLFVAAKINHLMYLPQGRAERAARARGMVAQMDREGFGHCTNHYECAETCPKEISVENIARMNREFLRASLSVE